MAEELFCPKHGPYPASARRCPYCAREQGELPPAPPSLYSEEESTFGVNRASQNYSDDDETILPGQPAPSGKDAFPPERRGNDEDETLPPARRGGSRRGGEDDEATLPPVHRGRGQRILDEPDSDEDVTVIDREDTSLMGWLIVKSGQTLRRGHILKVRSGAIYGRSSNKADVLIDDEKVSSIHARIQVKDEKFILVDLGSTNGTFVNGEKITGATEIHQDDEIRIGNTVFVLKTLQ